MYWRYLQIDISDCLYVFDKPWFLLNGWAGTVKPHSSESLRVTDLPKGSGRRCPWQRVKSLAGTPVVGMGRVCRTIWPGKVRNDFVDSVDGSSSKSGSMCSSILCWLW